MAEQNRKLEHLVALVTQHATEEGISRTRLENVGTFKSTHTQVRMPSYYDPAIVIVGQGKKRCYIGDKSYEYGAGDYLILFLPMSMDVEILEANPEFTQRQMAREMGISLGKFNYCLKELVKKGFVKVDRFTSSDNKAAHMYLLTPRGIEEKARVTHRFLKRKMAEFEEIRIQIEELKKEIPEVDQ